MAMSSPKAMLVDCYRTYLGQLREVSEVDVWVGVGITGGGALLAVVGWLVFLWNEMGTYGGDGFYAVRELAIAGAGLGIPLLLLGVVTMLLGNDRVTMLAVAGLSVCLGAVLLFVATYPSSWDVPAQFNAPIGVSLYGLGAALITFAAGAAYGCRVTGRFESRAATSD
jgi:hypothetical protein